MKKLLISMVLMALLSCMTVGCTTAENPLQHVQRLQLQKEVQSRQLVEDFEMFWLCDRASSLTKWHNQTGL